MRLEQINAAIVRRMIEEVWNNQRPESANQLFNADFNCGARWPRGPEGIRRRHQEGHAGCPDVHYSVDDLFAAEDRVVVRWTATATHLQPFGPIAPTGRRLCWTGMHIFRLERGRIAQAWGQHDLLGRLEQLGVTLDLPQAAEGEAAVSTGGQRLNG